MIVILLFFVLLCGLAPLLGKYIADVFEGKVCFARKIVGPIESLCFRVCRIDVKEEMNWVCYAKSLVIFTVFGFIALFLLQLFQHVLPLNPQHLKGVSWLLAFNTAASFVTNTNWQAYAGETTLSYLTQMLGLTVQNFLSAASGMSVLFALIRGLTRKSCETLGNFWSDLVRSVLYVFLPLSIILALVLISEGTIQSLSSYVEVSTLEGKNQVIPQGPVASQVAIKQLGTNGGGFFNVNSAHPFENPSAFSNFLEVFAIILIPASLVFTYGSLTQSKRHGYLLFAVMLLFFVLGNSISMISSHIYNPVIDIYPIMEGVETRFGIANSTLWINATTATANGSVNTMISSASPFVGGIALFNIMLGELIFGGVGVGLCSMIMFVLLTVFLSGLMVGRTPEYLGKKVEKREMIWVMIAILIPGALILIGSGISFLVPAAISSIKNQGPHGFSEVLYAFVSSAGNNGSAFAGLNVNTSYYNSVLAVVMLLGRLGILIPTLVVSGLLVRKKITPFSVGTFSTSSFLFAILLFSVIIIVGALTFFPALSLGPIVEHLLMVEGRSF
ncbi:MAG: potassium-transporting ATPase subunit KdpA [Chlamydiales bacterium]|nr:potassium-transporting ATPase subunit KdpA [Chlamydiales bacterium]